MQHGLGRNRAARAGVVLWQLAGRKLRKRVELTKQSASRENFVSATMFRSLLARIVTQSRGLAHVGLPGTCIPDPSLATAFGFDVWRKPPANIALCELCKLQ